MDAMKPSYASLARELARTETPETPDNKNDKNKKKFLKRARTRKVEIKMKDPNLKVGVIQKLLK